MTEHLDVVIVGGGVAGLTVAWRLRQRSPERSVLVLEASDRAGGRIRTELLEHDDGRFVIELGADSLLSAKPAARQLCSELGLDDEIIPIQSATHPTAIWRNGRPVSMPAGLSLLAPLQPDAFRASGLLSDAGLERALREPEIPVRAGDEDESLGSFVSRRFGREHLEGIAEPLLAGIYNADPDDLSLMSSFPNFRKLELEYGSVTHGTRQVQRGSADDPAFFSLRHGIEQLPLTLGNQLGQAVRTGARVERIEPIDGSGYRLSLVDGIQLTATLVVLATPLSVTRTLVDPLAPGSERPLGRLRAAASGAIVLAWRTEQIADPLPGYGLVCPKREAQPFNAITVMSSKYEGRAPEGWSLLRFFFGGYRSPATLELDDGGLLDAAAQFAARAIGVTVSPAFHRIARWPEGSPIYQVGHADTIDELDAMLPAGLFVTGAPFRGPGIPDVVRNAGELAEHLATLPISIAA